MCPCAKTILYCKTPLVDGIFARSGFPVPCCWQAIGWRMSYQPSGFVLVLWTSSQRQERSRPIQDGASEPLPEQDFIRMTTPNFLSGAYLKDDSPKPSTSSQHEYHLMLSLL